MFIINFIRDFNLFVVPLCNQIYSNCNVLVTKHLVDNTCYQSKMKIFYLTCNYIICVFDPQYSCEKYEPTKKYFCMDSITKSWKRKFVMSWDECTWMLITFFFFNLLLIHMYLVFTALVFFIGDFDFQFSLCIHIMTNFIFQK